MANVYVPGPNGRGQAIPWPRVLVGVPLERTVPGAVFHSFLAIAQRGHPFIVQNYTRTDIARDTFARTLLDSNATHVLMLDLDHRHPPDIVERLARWVKEDPARWVVGGLNFRRGEPYDPIALVEEEDGLYTIADWEQELLEVDLIGAGSLLVARQVFETIPAPWFGYDYKRAEEGHYPGNDIYFCRKCHEYGIQVYCDPTTTSPHLLEGWVTEGTYRTYMQQLVEQQMEV